MGFLKDKFQQVKEAGASLADRALIKASDITERARQTASDIHDKAVETKEAVQMNYAVGKLIVAIKTEEIKGRAAEKINALGDAIEQKAAKVSVAASQFGKSARRVLNPSAVEVAQAAPEATPAPVVEAPAVSAPAKAKAKKISAPKAAKNNGGKKKRNKQPGLR